MIELNLIPQIKLEYVRAQRARRRVISLVSVVSVASVGAIVLFGLFVYGAQPLQGVLIENGIKDTNDKLGKVANLNNYLTIQQQLNDLPALHSAKPMYSRIIGYLPILNPSAPNNIKITQLQIDPTSETGALKIQALAPTYTAATVFQSTLQGAQFTYTSDGQTATTPLFTSVALTNTSLTQDTTGARAVSFVVTLSVDEHVFAFASTNTGIAVPNKDATGSAQNVPVFSDGGN